MGMKDQLAPFRDKPLTAKQEKFCQNIVQGMTQLDAYRDAYDCKENSSKHGIEVNASTVGRKTEIALRINELRSLTSYKTAYTVDTAMAKLEETFRDAKALGNTASMVACVQTQCKLLGLNKEQAGEITIKLLGKDAN